MKRGILFALAATVPVATAASAGAGAQAQAARGLAPLLRSAAWPNARPAAETLRGSLVLVDVFTFECINCDRVAPNLKVPYHRYGRRHLAIVGVHTPEVPAYRSCLAYVASNARRYGLIWPPMANASLSTSEDSADSTGRTPAYSFQARVRVARRVWGPARDGSIGLRELIT